MHKKVLIVSYLFPPFGGVGVQRPLALARYLPVNGCETFVVTAGNAGTAIRDESLVRLIPENVSIHRTFTPELPYGVRTRIWSRISPGLQKAATGAAAPQRSLRKAMQGAARTAIQRILCPDPQLGWVPFATRTAARLIAKHNIDAVLVTVPPFSALRTAVALKRRFPAVRMIVDFRDEWIGYYMSTDRNADAYKRKVAVALEREAVTAADYIVTVTPSWIQQIRNRHTDQPEDKFLCIPNGYDPETFRDFRSRSHGEQKIVITHMGTVYANPVYSPRTFLQAVDSLPEEIRSKMEVRFVGRVAPEELHFMQSCRPNPKLLGFMPQAEAFRQMEDSDYLLLVVNDRMAHAGKLFEYMATGKPILAITQEDGEIARVLKETGTGVCVDAGSVSKIQDMLKSIYTTWQAGRIVSPDRNDLAVRAYARPQLVQKLAELTGLLPADGDRTLSAKHTASEQALN